MDTGSVTGTLPHEEILGVLSGFIAGIIGGDVVEQIGVGRDSTFTGDLEMDSIEIVAFAEKVKRRYGDRVDFISWLSGMAPGEIYGLSIGRVVDFIVGGKDEGS